MSLQRFQAEGRLRVHRVTKNEISALLALAERDLKDASVEGLSSDRRFMIAYDAALTLATIPLYCAGVETHGKGHHWLTFKLLPEVMGEPFSDLADYLDQCRTKRNVGAYDRGGLISKAEVAELIKEVDVFRDDISTWLRGEHPGLID